MTINTETEEYITEVLLRELFEYIPDTGILLRKITTSSKAKAGSVAGYMADNGYLELMLFGNKYSVHRLIWKYTYGVFPTEFIDHINRIRSDNRLANLREATPLQNSYNMSLRKDSTSGFTGVSLDKRSGKYRAYITIDKKQKSLGYYNTAEEARLAREVSAEELHGEFHNENTIYC